MSATLNYAVNIQRVDADNAIRNQFDVEGSIALPDQVIGDTTIALANNTADQQVALLDSVMDFIFIETDTEIVVKYNDVTGTPFTLRADGSMLVDGKNISALYLSNTSGATAVVRILQALRQDV